MRNGNLILLILFFSICAVSCSHKTEIGAGSGIGEVIFDLSTEIGETKADLVEGSLNVDDFTVELLNPEGVIFKRWETYREYKDQDSPRIPMNVGGPYTIRATYGDATAVGFEAFYFKGEQQFYVQPQETSTVAVTCRMANVKVGVNFGQTMTQEYRDIVVKVSNMYGELIFTEANVNERGYLPAKYLTLDVELVSNEDDKTYFFQKTDIVANAGDFLTLNIDTEEVPEYGVSINVTVDYSTEDIQETINIPSYTLPYDAPDLTVKGFDASGSISLVEGLAPAEANISINAEASIASCKLDIASAYLASVGFPATVDLLNVDAKTAELFGQYEFFYTDEMGGTNMGNVDFKDFAKNLAYHTQDNTHTFTLTVTDTLDKVTSKTVKFVSSMANKSVNSIQNYDVWARKAHVTMNTSNGDPSRLYPEISTDGGSNWQKASFETVSVNGTAHEMTIKGLEPGTTYSLRAAYNLYGSDNSVNITTEAAVQVPNSNMEEWTEGQVQSYALSSSSKQYTYYPWANNASKVWDTNNAATTKASGTPGYLEKKCFPMVSFVNGKDGGRAAQIMAIAVNGGNTNGTSLSDAVPGELFIGTYGGTRNTAFASRPNKMKFWFKYDIRTDNSNNDDTYRALVVLYDGANKIGEGKLEYTTTSDVNSWTEATVDITYTDETKKATAIYIQFLQSTRSNPVYNMDVAITYGGTRTANVHGGSILTVDDIELIYE